MNFILVLPFSLSPSRFLTAFVFSSAAPSVPLSPFRSLFSTLPQVPYPTQTLQPYWRSYFNIDASLFYSFIHNPAFRPLINLISCCFLICPFALLQVPYSTQTLQACWPSYFNTDTSPLCLSSIYRFSDLLYLFFPLFRIRQSLVFILYLIR